MHTKAARLAARSCLSTIALAALAVSALLAVLASAACEQHSPSAPGPATVAGTWAGEQTIVSLAGGDCLATPLQDIVGLPSQFHATIEQSGASLTATLDIDHLGAVCSFEGTLDGNSLELHATTCTESKQVGLRCTGGETRDILQSSTVLRGTVADNRITGMAVETDSVVLPGTTQTVAPLLFTSTATLVRQ